MELIQSIMPEKGYIFSLSKGKSPLTGNRLTDNFYTALEKMGIDIDERKERNITFHSFRHWFVTFLRGKGISDAEITSITGQKTSQIIEGLEDIISTMWKHGIITDNSCIDNNGNIWISFESYDSFYMFTQIALNTRYRDEDDAIEELTL